LLPRAGGLAPTSSRSEGPAMAGLATIAARLALLQLPPPSLIYHFLGLGGEYTLKNLHYLLVKDVFLPISSLLAHLFFLFARWTTFSHVDKSA
jgi:hypothetical protein